MSIAIQALSVFLPCAWLATAVMHAIAPEETARGWTRLMRLMLAVAILMHVALFTCKWQAAEGFPVVDTWSSLSAVALCVVLLHVLTSPRDGASLSGAVIYGLACLLQACASAFGSLSPGSNLPGSFTVFHVMTSIVAAGAVVLSGMHGFSYLMVFRQMRRRHIGTLVRGLPSLATLAALVRRSALAGFILLTIGLNFGIGWAHYAEVDAFEYSDPSVMAMLVLWLHFGVVAFSRRVPGLSARRASIAAAGGLTVFLGVILLPLIPGASFHLGG